MRTASAGVASGIAEAILADAATGQGQTSMADWELDRKILWVLPFSLDTLVFSFKGGRIAAVLGN